MGAYAAAYQRSITDPARFWGLAARDVRWLAPPDRVLDDGAPPFYRWFTGGELNTCDNALDRHLDDGRGDQPALIWDGPAPCSYTYAELTERVARFAGVLAGLGVERGDRVLLLLPMSPDAVIAMLACARLGAVHAVSSGAAPAAEDMAARIDAVRPRAIVSMAEPDGAKPVLDAALRLASHKVGHCVIRRRPGAAAPGGTPPRDVDWDEAMAAARPVGCLPVAATDPLHILFTPGTTGPAKGVVRDNGGYAVALRWSMENLFGVGPGEAFGATMDVGWAAGLSCAIYAPLLTGCTIVLHEGNGRLWRWAAEHRVRGLLTTPSAIRSLGHPGDLPSLDSLLLAGGRTDAAAQERACRTLGRPVVAHWIQAESGRPITGIPHGLEPIPVRPGSAGVPMPGFDVQVLGPDGEPLPPGSVGDLGIRLPLPPGSLSTLWQDDARFMESYLTRRPGFYLTGDVGRRDEDGHVWITGRADT